MKCEHFSSLSLGSVQLLQQIEQQNQLIILAEFTDKIWILAIRLAADDRILFQPYFHSFFCAQIHVSAYMSMSKNDLLKYIQYSFHRPRQLSTMCENARSGEHTRAHKRSCVIEHSKKTNTKCENSENVETKLLQSRTIFFYATLICTRYSCDAVMAHFDFLQQMCQIFPPPHKSSQNIHIISCIVYILYASFLNHLLICFTLNYSLFCCLTIFYSLVILCYCFLALTLFLSKNAASICLG